MSPLQRLFVLRLVMVGVSAIAALFLIASFFLSRSPTQPHRSRFSMCLGRLYFAGVWLAYSSLALLLARWNVTFHKQPMDLRLEFTLLGLAAWAGYWFALLGSPYLRPRSVYRHIGLLALSLAALLFSTFYGCWS
jgi:hypothetical protein